MAKINPCKTTIPSCEAIMSSRENGGRYEYTPLDGCAHVFLCGDCDLTHLNYRAIVDGIEVQFHMNLDPRDAETLGLALISPEPAMGVTRRSRR